MVKAGEGYFVANAFGDIDRLSPHYADLIALADDVANRPHDQATRDRFDFEVIGLAQMIVVTIDEDEGDPNFLSQILATLIEDAARRARTDGH